MPHNAVLGTQQIVDKPIISRSHPAIIMGGKVRADQGIIESGVVVAKDLNGDMAPYEPALADAPSWVATIVKTAGALILPVGGNDHYYKCTTPGTTGAAEPTWPTTPGETVVDGTVVWEEVGLIGVDDLAGGGVLVVEMDTAEEAVGQILRHGCAVLENVTVAGAAPSDADIEAIASVGVYLV